MCARETDIAACIEKMAAAPIPLSAAFVDLFYFICASLPIQVSTFRLCLFTLECCGFSAVSLLFVLSSFIAFYFFLGFCIST